MLLFWCGLCVFIVLLVIFLRWYRNRTLAVKLIRLAQKAEITAGKNRNNRAKVDRFLKETYALIRLSSLKKDTMIAYQATDVLKLAIGEGLYRTDEPVRLMAAIVAAIRQKQPDIAGFILDAFRPLIRQIELDKMPQTIEQLLLIGVIALRHKESFLTAKVVDLLFYLLERSDTQTSEAAITQALKALRGIGVLGMRRQDAALFLEIITRLESWVRDKKPQAVADAFVEILTAWSHRSIKIKDAELFQLIESLTFALLEENVLTAATLENLLVELGNLAGSACLNPKNQVTELIIAMVLKMAANQQKLDFWLLAITICRKVGVLAISRHGISTAFPIYYPLLETGRRLLWTELKFISHLDEVRQKVLFRLTKECIMLAAFGARQDITATPGEIITEFYRCWMVYQPDQACIKSVKKFCQLLLLLWLKSKRQAKKYLPGDSELVAFSLFSDREKQHLGL